MERLSLIKILWGILLLVCVIDMPYGYFQFVRFVSFIGFGLLAFNVNPKEQQTELVVFIALAILFQPFIKISLGRTIWNVVDVIVGIYLLYSGFTENGKNK
jgi:hypothetical protein